MTAPQPPICGSAAWRRRLRDGCAAAALLLGLALPGQASAEYTTIITSGGSTVLINEAVLNSLGPPVAGGYAQRTYQSGAYVPQAQTAYNYGFAGPVPAVPIGAYAYGGTIVAQPRSASTYAAAPASPYVTPTYGGTAYSGAQVATSPPTNLLGGQPYTAGGKTLLTPPSEMPRSHLTVSPPPRSQSVASAEPTPRKKTTRKASSKKTARKTTTTKSKPAETVAQAPALTAPAQPVRQAAAPSDALVFLPTGNEPISERPVPGEVQVAQIEPGVLVDMPLDIPESEAEVPAAPSVTPGEAQAPLAPQEEQTAKVEPLVLPSLSPATGLEQQPEPQAEPAPRATTAPSMTGGSGQMPTEAPVATPPSQQSAPPTSLQQAEAGPQTTTVAQPTTPSVTVPVPSPMPPASTPGETSESTTGHYPSVGETLGHTTTGVTSGPRDLSAIPTPQPMPHAGETLPLSSSASEPSSVAVPAPVPLPHAETAAGEEAPPEPSQPASAGQTLPLAASPPTGGQAATKLAFSNQPPPLQRNQGRADISLGKYVINAEPETAVSSRSAGASAPTTGPSAASTQTLSSARSTTSGSPRPLPPEPRASGEAVAVLPSAPQTLQPPATLSPSPGATPVPGTGRTTGQATTLQSPAPVVLPQPEPMPSVTAPRATTAGTSVVQTQRLESTTSAAVPKPEPWPATGQSSTPAAIVQQQATTAGTSQSGAGQQSTTTAMLPRALSSGSGAAGSAAQTAALPPVTQSDGELSVPFAEGSADVADSYKPALQQLAFQLVSDPAIRIRLIAYARSGDGGEGRARRLSLSRALAVRSYLMRQGVQSTRMDVRALGSNATSGPADRVDIVPAS